MFAWWPECLDLVAVQCGQPVQEYLLGDAEFVCHLDGTARPAGNFLQALETDKEARYFQADLPFDGRWLAAVVAVLDMDCLVGQVALPLRSREFRVNPNTPAIGGRNYVRVRTVPNNYDVRE